MRACEGLRSEGDCVTSTLDCARGRPVGLFTLIKIEIEIEIEIEEGPKHIRCMYWGMFLLML